MDVSATLQEMGLDVAQTTHIIDTLGVVIQFDIGTLEEEDVITIPSLKPVQRRKLVRLIRFIESNPLAELTDAESLRNALIPNPSSARKPILEGRTSDASDYDHTVQA
eukprot:scaffold876_cov243-Pinguiococcus_pyrenoidosus.AAC.2